jgi:hypothetical protein
MDPEREAKIAEAMEELRINYNLRQYRVCMMICQCLEEKFRELAEKTQK